MELSYLLSSEEHGPRRLLQYAQSAERHGFSSVMVTDHYFPWLDEQGESPFVWSVMGAIGATTSLRVMTGVTCPTVRIHPAVVAHAAATSAALIVSRRLRPQWESVDGAGATHRGDRQKGGRSREELDLVTRIGR